MAGRWMFDMIRSGSGIIREEEKEKEIKMDSLVMDIMMCSSMYRNAFNIMKGYNKIIYPLTDILSSSSETFSLSFTPVVRKTTYL